ncbi:MAG TPA: cytidylate kinase family protein [Candidatus Saccharimonadales bacterium]|nr:cytidylate kinase family protein [Candidatus Saccharimonadales bacterium]
MEAIVLSGLPAAGKTTVGEILCAKLGFKLIGGGDILKEMAAERGFKVTGKEWWDTPEGVRFLKEREGNSDFDKEVDRRIVGKIAGGDVVITSYTAPWITKDGFKVWLEGSVQRRTERMAKRDGAGVGEMKEMVKVRDTENKKLYKNLYNIDYGRDKTPFDLVVNTNDMPPEGVAETIIKKYKERNG